MLGMQGQVYKDTAKVIHDNCTYRVVEKLLELLIGVIDAELLKTVELKNFESCYIQDSNKTKKETHWKVHAIQ